MERPNLDYFDKLSNKNVAFREKLIAVVKYEWPLEINTYQESLRDNELVKTAEAVHKLKHKIGVLGMEKGYEVAQNYENNLRDGSTVLQFEFEQTTRTISEFINAL